MPLSPKTNMSKQDMLNKLNEINIAIDKRILDGKSYADLAKKHRRILNLLNQ